LNVVGSEGPIKGLTAPPAINLSLEQLIGGISMLGGVGHMPLDAGNFAFENFDPFAQLVDRYWAEVLANEQGQRIAGLAREEIIFVHDCSER
jgi:hypothetical protein